MRLAFKTVCAKGFTGGGVGCFGGGTGGDLAEILKYPRTNIDDVEFDPALLRLADRYLPEAERRPLHDARVRLRIEDARAFLARDDLPFDAILADLPAPATIKTNRYYTIEFFRDVRARLRPGGVFGFRVPSAENYLSPALTVFLRSIRATLASVFPEIAIVPGGTKVSLPRPGRLPSPKCDLTAVMSPF